MKVSKKTNYIFDAVAFGEALATKRIIKLKLSLKEAQQISGVSNSTLSKCERGMLPDMMTFATLCTWLEIEPTKFFKQLIK
jgi:transcriptional regulator with XRE-family HTH domain